MKKKKFLKSLLWVAILATLAWFVWPKKTIETNDLQKITITQYGQGKIFLYLPLYIAMEQGYFKENGLDVELTYSGNDDQIAATVTGGYADFGVGDPIFSAIIQSRGGNLKTIAILVAKPPFIGYTNKENIPEIDDLTSLNNLSVSSFPAPSTLYTNLSNLKTEHNLTMNIKPMAFGSQMAAAKAGEVDIAMDLDPTVAIAEREGFRSVISLSRFLPPQAITGITTREDYINKHPEIVQKVVNALQKAVKAFYENENIGINVAKKTFADIDEISLKRAVERSRQNAIYPTSLAITESLWQQGIAERLNSGDLDAPQPTATATDNTFAIKAYENYGK